MLENRAVQYQRPAVLLDPPPGLLRAVRHPSREVKSGQAVHQQPGQGRIILGDQEIGPHALALRKDGRGIMGVCASFPPIAASRPLTGTLAAAQSGQTAYSHLICQEFRWRWTRASESTSSHFPQMRNRWHCRHSVTKYLFEVVTFVSPRYRQGIPRQGPWGAPASPGPPSLDARGRPSKARRTIWRTRSGSMGLVRKSCAPSLTARTALSMSL